MQLQRLNNPLAAIILGLDVKEDSTVTASNITNAFQETSSTALLQIHTSAHTEWFWMMWVVSDN